MSSAVNGTLTNGDHNAMLLDPNGLQKATESGGMKKSVSASRFVVDVVPKPSDSQQPSLSSAPNLCVDIPSPLEIVPEADENSPHPKSKVVSFQVEPHSPADSSVHTSNQTYGTSNVKSFRNVETLEKIPNIDHYRNVMSIVGAMHSRPTLAELHEDKELPDDLEMGEMDHAEGSRPSQGSVKVKVPREKQSGPKFGWIQGVLIRCILNIIGVMLYLRLSWLTGQAGIGLGTLIVLVSCLVTTITAISMCAISTNGEIRGGGAYFMISRSLGPEFGGAIGLIFAFANAVATAMYAVGFAETVRDLMKEHGAKIIDNGSNDIRIIAVIATLLLLAVTVVGVAFESKMQMVLMVILSFSILDYMVGTVVPPSDDKAARGLTGFSSETFKQNFVPSWRDGENFWSVLAVFFPAATGILAGANISGDLADPQKSIPKGTLLAILITTIIYIGCVWLCGATVLRDASGLLLDLQFGNITDCAANGTHACQYGLLNYFQVMEMSSVWGPLITAGIFAATLSSALASLVSAPKVFQAVCQDKLFPFIHVFAKGYGSSNEPRRAYLLAFGIAVGVILIGDLNLIAPIISNFFLAAYALVNYATFDATLAKTPGFRPSFKFYNMWLSLLGAVLCVAFMFIISWWTALITFAFIAVLYLYVQHRKPDVNWGSSSQAHNYKNALQAMHKLQVTEEHIKNYRPQILVLTGNPVARPSLVDFAANITKETSLMVCGHIVISKGTEPVPTEHLLLALSRFRFQILEWFRKRKIKSFYNPVAAGTFREGVQNLLQLSGLGKLRINVVMLGYKNNWNVGSSLDQIAEYFNVIHDCFDASMGVGILRLPHGLDFTEEIRQHNLDDSGNLRIPEAKLLPKVSSCVNLNEEELDTLYTNNPLAEESRTNLTLTVPTGANLTLPVRNGIPPAAQLPPTPSKPAAKRSEDDKNLSNIRGAEELTQLIDSSFSPQHSGSSQRNSFDKLSVNVNSGANGDNNDLSSPYKLSVANLHEVKQMSPVEQEIVANINEFQKKLKKAVIDVWWLFDDGGLTLLVPHLLAAQKSYLEGAKLRVFTIATSKNKLEQEQRSMAALLSKFRIDFSDVTVIPDIMRKPSASSIKEFEDLISEFKVVDDDNVESSDQSGILISEAELLAQREKTYRQLRTKELLVQHSKDASLIVLTLPVPRKGACSACLYLSWLEILTRGMPPILLLRGNQQSVLTFYS